MGLKLVNILAILVLSSLASTTTSQAGVFDVTSSIYGGKPHSDISQVQYYLKQFCCQIANMHIQGLIDRVVIFYVMHVFRVW